VPAGSTRLNSVARVSLSRWRGGIRAAQIARLARCRGLAVAFPGSGPGNIRGRFMPLWSASIGNNARRAGSSSPPRLYCHSAFQHGPAPNIAHSFFASSESRLGRVGTRAISSASAEPQRGAQSQLNFCYFAFLTRAALKLGSGLVSTQLQCVRTNQITEYVRIKSLNKLIIRHLGDRHQALALGRYIGR
jgi:hypothetical protein